MQDVPHLLLLSSCNCLLARSLAAGDGGGGGRGTSAIGTPAYFAPEVRVWEDFNESGGGMGPQEYIHRLDAQRAAVLSEHAHAFPDLSALLKWLGPSVSQQQQAALVMLARQRMADAWSGATMAAMHRVLHQGYAGPPVDSWTLGVLMYRLLFGKEWPFYEAPVAPRESSSAPRSLQLFHQQLSRFYATSGVTRAAHIDNAVILIHISETAREFMDRLLDPNPDTRQTPAAALQHPWLSRQGSSGGGGA